MSETPLFGQEEGKRSSHLGVSGRSGVGGDMVEQGFLNLTVHKNYLGSESADLTWERFYICNRFPENASAATLPH